MGVWQWGGVVVSRAGGKARDVRICIGRLRKMGIRDRRRVVTVESLGVWAFWRMGAWEFGRLGAGAHARLAVREFVGKNGRQ